MKRICSCLILAGLVITGCSSTQYRDAREDKGSREWGAREITTTVDKMVYSLYARLKEENTETFIEVKKIRNGTGEHIDTSILSDEIVTQLIKKRIKFIDRTYTQAAIKEMELGMSGMIDPENAVPTGALKSPNFYLYGEIRENIQYQGRKQKQYLVVTLQLTSLASGEVIWKDQQDFYKISKTTRVSH